jgi:eukaryotic-like serine/threonine-protein kinase
MDPDQFAEDRVGSTLRGKWTLEKLLGVGGMAAVYAGAHKIGQRAAIKILHPEIARSAELRARFEQEAHAVNRFKHPGVVEIRDIDVAEDGAPFLVMELLEGSTLADLAEGPAGVDQALVLRVADELLDVLAAAHAQGIVHRDIKPDNLFLLRDGRLKVLDFGIARVKDGMGSLRTRAGAMLGTAPYMAPEQIKGKDIDARVDVFAAGATMFRLLARRRIHEASSEPELLVKMATQKAPPLCSVAPDVPPELGRIVDRALALDRDERYPDAASMQRDVQALRAGMPAVAVAAVPAPVTVEATTAAAPLLLPLPEPVSRTLPASVVPAQPPPAPVRADETRTALMVLTAALGVLLLLAIVTVIALLLRPGPDTDASTPAATASASATDDPRPPAARDPDDLDDGPARPPGPPRGKGHGHGHGHGKGKHKDD